MQIISIYNKKGGVGKTTLCFNLASIIAQYQHKKVLIIDADPSAFLSMTFAQAINRPLVNNRIPMDDSLYDYIFRDLPFEEVVRHYQFDRFTGDIFRVVEEHKKSKSVRVFSLAKDKITTSEKPESVADGRSSTRNCCVDFISGDGRFEEKSPDDPYVLQKKLEEIRNRYDVVFIDSPPEKVNTQPFSLIASNAIIAPLVPDFYSAKGYADVLDDVSDVNQRYKTSIRFLGIVFSHFKIDSLTSKYIDRLIQIAAPNDYLFRDTFDDRSLTAKALAVGIPVGVFVNAARDIASTMTQEELRHASENASDYELKNSAMSYLSMSIELQQKTEDYTR